MYKYNLEYIISRVQGEINMYNIHRHVFRPSQDSSVWVGLTSTLVLAPFFYPLKMFLQNRQVFDIIIAGMQLAGGRCESPLLFFENWKKAPRFWKKMS